MKSSQQMLAALLLSALALITQAQNMFTVPNEPPCPGARVVMSCNIEPPTNESFLSFFTPDISINGSQPYSSTEINNNQIPGLDTSRYQISDTDPWPDYPKLAAVITITSYQPQDSATTFGCHGKYFNESYSPALASGEAPMPARIPDQIDFVFATIESVNSFVCQAVIDVRFSTPDSDKPIQYYELYSNGVYIRKLDSQTGVSDYNNPSTYLYMTPGQSYSLRVAAVSCAGSAPLSQYDVTLSLPLRTIGFFFFADLNPKNNLELSWFFSEDDDNTTITIGYSLQVKTTFISGDMNTVVTQTTEFSLPSTDTDYELELGLTSLGESVVEYKISTTIQIISQCDITLSGTSKVSTNSGNSTIQFFRNSNVELAAIVGIIILILILIACAVFSFIVVIALIVTCAQNGNRYRPVMSAPI